MHFTELPDLASERLGGAVLSANDEFFAPKENLLKTSKPVFIEGRYTDLGKWMDGWETRRRRSPGYDWCIVRLGLPGVPRGVIVDTAHFKGNYPESCSLESREEDEAAAWTEILAESPLKGDCENRFSIDTERRATHLRFKIYPDGGVARLRVYGEVAASIPYEGEVDLAAIENGGLVIASSDMFFGSRQNLIMPGRALDMSDGWETRRRRGPGHDWVIIRLGAAGMIERVEVDTSHFKGNYPESCLLEACDEAGAPSGVILPRAKLEAHTRRIFRQEIQRQEIQPAGPAAYVRFSIFPDGGVSRLRLYGRRAARPADESQLLACCGSREWARRMKERQPFRSAEQMLEAADQIWWELAPRDWLEAFAAHPRIGESSSHEQSGVAQAPTEVLARLAAGNRAYEERFGHIYIVRASGRTAEQMLALLESRLSNDAETELRVAAGQQREIMRLRLEQWLKSL